MRGVSLPVVVLAMILAALPAVAQDGKVTLTSKAAFAKVAEALEKAIGDHKMALVCHANAQQGAAARSVKIAGNQVFMVFRNDFAVRVLAAAPEAGFEAPLRIYLYESPDGTATLTYVKPSAVFRPYPQAGGREGGRRAGSHLREDRRPSARRPVTAVGLSASLLLALVFGTASAGDLRCPDPSRMVPIPAGPFWMGSDEAERGLARSLSSQAVREARWFDAELPRRRTTLPAYCLDRYLVTQRDYAAFVQATGRTPPGITRAEYERQGFRVHDYDRTWTRFLWRESRPPAGSEDHPVVLVSAPDAEAYCRWRGLRLPSEAEWEKGSRGSDGRPFPWGERWEPDRLNSAERGPGGTTPVTRYAGGVSPFGLFDAVGNVFQWTSTSLGERRQRVVKGCAWDDEAGLCRPAFRHARPASSRHILIGFRCAGPQS